MSEPKPTKPPNRVAQATTGIVNIVVLGTASVGALALHSWAIAAVGGVAYGALVAWDLVSGKKRAGGTVAEKPKLADPSEYRDPATQTAVRAIVAAKLEIDRVLEETPPDVRANLALALTSIAELDERAAGLASRTEDIARYLSTTDPRVAQQDVEALARRIAEARDPQAKAQYEHAHAARKELVQTLGDLSAARERAHATLLSIGATLEGLPAKIVRMRALDAQAMDALTGDVQEELQRMNGEIRTFEEVLKGLAEVK